MTPATTLKNVERSQHGNREARRRKLAELLKTKKFHPSEVKYLKRMLKNV